MELEEIFGNLCNKDPRHPMFVELYGEDDCRPVPRAPECSCDNCFYGRDRLATEILRLKELVSMTADAKLERWLELIASKLNQLVEIGLLLEKRSNSVNIPEEWGEHFADASKMVAEESAKEPEHPAGPKPDPGEGYRILSKEPPEDLTPGDEYEEKPGFWVKSSNAENCGIQANRLWYRRKIEQPVKQEPPQPRWEPKVGDWVRVTRPQNWQECRNPDWSTVMHQYDDNVMQVSCYEKRWGSWVANFYGIDWFFHRDWLSPAEPPVIDKPAEPEYREPVLPADANKECQFSDDGIEWRSELLYGWTQFTRQWVSDLRNWKYARIKTNP